MGELGIQELIVILIIALLFFGGKKLPEVASSMGKAVREFKGALSEPGRPDTAGRELADQRAKNETR